MTHALVSFLIWRSGGDRWVDGKRDGKESGIVFVIELMLVNVYVLVHVHVHVHMGVIFYGCMSLYVVYM